MKYGGNTFGGSGVVVSGMFVIHERCRSEVVVQERLSMDGIYTNECSCKMSKRKKSGSILDTIESFKSDPPCPV